MGTRKTNIAVISPEMSVSENPIIQTCMIQIALLSEIF